MGKFDGILLVTDLDGTLLKHDQSISKENVEAIEYFKANGGKFTIVTGRVPCALAGIDEIVKPNAPLGCVNGGAIYDAEQKKIVWAETADREILEFIAYIDKEMPTVSHQINTTEHIWFTKSNDAMDYLRRVSKVENLTCHYSEVTEPILKILFADFDLDNMKKVTELIKSHPLIEKYDSVSSEPMYYEVLPKGISKGVAIPKLCEILGIGIDRTIAVGDNNNDVTMLEVAGLGVAVSNATENAKQAADKVTVSNEESAIAKIIEELDKGIIIL